MSNVAIWKFTLTRDKVKMPTHARLLSTAFQGDDLQVWAVVVQSNPHKMRRFAIIATGQATEDARGDFVGTAFHSSGLVYHIFDRGYVDTPTIAPAGDGWREGIEAAAKWHDQRAVDIENLLDQELYDETRQHVSLERDRHLQHAISIRALAPPVVTATEGWQPITHWQSAPPVAAGSERDDGQ